jgi:hypothetical protein
MSALWRITRRERGVVHVRACSGLVVESRVWQPQVRFGAPVGRLGMAILGQRAPSTELAMVRAGVVGRVSKKAAAARQVMLWRCEREIWPATVELITSNSASGLVVLVHSVRCFNCDRRQQQAQPHASIHSGCRTARGPDSAVGLRVAESASVTIDCNWGVFDYRTVKKSDSAIGEKASLEFQNCRLQNFEFSNYALKGRSGAKLHLSDSFVGLTTCAVCSLSCCSSRPQLLLCWRDVDNPP